MAIITTSGRVVKRKVCGVRPVMRACRAKAAAPWAGWVYSTAGVDAVCAPDQADVRALLTDWDAAPSLVRCEGCGEWWAGGSPGEPCDQCKIEATQDAYREAEADDLREGRESSMTFGYVAW